MSTTPQNQIQSLVSLQQTQCADVWSKYGLSASERHEKLEEFKRTLHATYEDFTQAQIQEAADLEQDIQQTRDHINTQLARLGMTMPLPPLAGTLKEQYNTTTERSQEVLEKVKLREKELFALTTSIRKLSHQLNQPIPPNCTIDPDGTSDLSHQFMVSLQQIESELRAHVQKNLSLLHESLPFLVYYLKEMNLYSELGWIYQSAMEWEEQGLFIKKCEGLIGPEVSEILSNNYQFTEFDNIIQLRVNLALLPSVKDLQAQGIMCGGVGAHDVDTTELFSQYNQHLDFSQFPIEVQFIKELQQKVLQLQLMYRERGHFASEIGEKIRNLWELTETSSEEASAWSESCRDLSMPTLRTFQLELIRLSEKKSALLPQWIANHERMLVGIGKQLGYDSTEIDRRLHFCRSQYSEDLQLESLRVELGQVRAELAIRQPILDKITQFNESCRIGGELKELENHPDRYKDAKIRKRLDLLRKECNTLPQKAAQLNKAIVAFEQQHGELYNAGQRILTVLQQNEHWEQARKSGLIIESRAAGGLGSRLTKATSMPKIGTAAATPAAPAAKMNTTRAGSSGAVLKPAEDSKLNRTRIGTTPGTTLTKTIGGNVTKSAIPVNNTQGTRAGIPGTKPTLTSSLARGAAARPIAQDARRRSQEAAAEGIRKNRLRE